MLEGLARWAFGLYPPAVPKDLRLTETQPSASGLTRIVSRIDIPPRRRAELEAYQQQQHDVMNELQQYIGDREIEQQQP